MALIGNYNVLNKNPGRYFAGTSSSDRVENNKSGASRNFYFADFGVLPTGLSTTVTHPLFSYARQIGYAPPYSWNISPKDGGMAMTNYSSSSVSFNLIPQYSMTSALTGSGSLAATINGLGNIIAALSGSSSFTVSITSTGNILLSMTGSGSLTLNITGKGIVVVGMTGSSSFTAAASLFLNMISAMTGSGTLSANASLVVGMICAMSGGATMTMNITGQKAMSTSLTGTGNLAADINAFAEMALGLIGSGALNAGFGAIAQMSIDMVVTGTGLNTGNVGQAVWESLISQFSSNPNSAAAKLLAAGSAGDPWSSNLPASYTGTQAGNILAQIQTLVDELHKIAGLDAANPSTVTPATWDAGGIHIDITGNGTDLTKMQRN